MKKRSWHKLLSYISIRIIAACRVIAGSRPARWIAGQKIVILAASLLRIIWYVIANYVWWPVKRAFRKTLSFLRRREVLPWMLTWIVCAVLALAIIQPFMGYVKLVTGSLAAIAFVLISLRSPFAGLMIWLVTSPFLNKLIFFKLMEGTPIITGDRVFIAILFAVLLAQTKRDTKVHTSWMLHASMALFVVAMLFATLRSESPKWSAQLVLDAYFAPILVYLYARRWITDYKRLALVMLAMVFIGTYFAVLAIPEHFTGKLFFKPTHQGWVEPELGTVRVQGPAESPNEFGLVVAAGILLSMVGLANTRIKWKQVLYCAVIIIMVVAMAYTLRRSVYIGTIIAIIALLAGTSRTRKLSAAVLIVCSVVGLIGWQGFSQSKLYRARLGDVKPIYSRIIIQATAWNAAKDNIVSGVGVGNFGMVRHRYVTSYGDIMPFYAGTLVSPHSSYLLILVEGGLLAFLPFCLMVTFMIVNALRAWKRARAPGLVGRDGVIVFLGLTLGVLSQAASTDTFFQSHYLVSLWFLFLGAIVSVHLRDRDVQTVDQQHEALPERSPRAYSRARW